MADLVLIDKLTLKRNTVLENRLQVRLQIIGKEYRMTRKDIEQHTRDLADFLVYVRHTAPGLSAYSQPDTRSMKAENTLGTPRSKARQTNDLHKILLRQKSLNMEAEGGTYECGWSKEETGVSGGHVWGKQERGVSGGHVWGKEERGVSGGHVWGKEERGVSGGHVWGKEERGVSGGHVWGKEERGVSGGHVWGKEETGVSGGHERAGGEEFNCLVHYCDISSKNDLASEKETGCRLQRTINEKNSCSAEHENSEPRKPDSGSSYRKESLAEFEGTRRSTSLHQCHRVQSAKYGRSAYTQKDEILRQIIFRRFEAIFNVRGEKQPETMSYLKLASPSDASRVKDIGLLEAATIFPIREHRQQPSYTKDKLSSSQIVTNRLTWSAPHRHHVLRMRPETGVNIPNHRLHTASSPPDCLPSCSDPAEMTTTQQTSISLMSDISLHELDADLRSRASQQPEKTLKRPKTAPPNYELKQKSVPAPRQQVAGFQAEANSRRFETRVILKKSRQLQQMVKMLAPSEQSDDNSTD